METVKLIDVLYENNEYFGSEGPFAGHRVGFDRQVIKAYTKFWDHDVVDRPDPKLLAASFKKQGLPVDGGNLTMYYKVLRHHFQENLKDAQEEKDQMGVTNAQESLMDLKTAFGFKDDSWV